MLFTKVESYFVDAKFYIKNDVIQEVILTIILSTRKAKLKGRVEQCEPTLTREIS